MKTRRIIAVILVLVTAFALCSCAEGKQAAYRDDSTSIRPSNGAMYSDKTSAEGYPIQDTDGSEIMKSDVEDYTRKIIKHQYLTVETLTFDAALSKIDALVAELGGYYASTDISSGSTYGYGYYSENRYAQLSIRIPENKIDDFVKAISSTDTFNVTRNSLSTEEVTDTYYDLKAQLSALMDQEARLTALMNEAKNLSDMLAIESKVTSVRKEINAVSSRIQYYDKAVAMSFVDIKLNEVKKYEPTKEKTFFDKVGEAFVGAWEVFASFLEGAFLVLLWILPFVLVLGGVAAIIIVVVIRNKKKKKAAKAKEFPPSEHENKQ